MVWAGAEGERIVAVRVSYHDPGTNGKRIVALLLETNWGQRRDVANWSAFTDDAPPDNVVQRRELECDTTREIVGLHYVIGVSYVHDIGLITRDLAANT